jgi:glyoxylase-like metal-dependent hydrolase (beta-lactamase superfamily II)
MPDRSTARPQVDAFFDKRTCSVQYIVSDPTTGHCALIDPVLDYDEKSGSIATTSADALLARVKERGLTVEWVLDTHPHADHLSACDYLKERTGAKTAIGERIVEVQRLWKEIYNLGDLKADGSQWDCLFADGDDFQIGNMDVRVVFSPGHTLASITYVVGDAAFIHDTLFMPDFGTARCDFPGGDARALWRTIQRILALPTCRAGGPHPGKARLPARRPKTLILSRLAPKMNSLQCVRNGMPSYRCRSLFFTPYR